MKARGDTGDGTVVLGSFLHTGERFFDDRVYLRDVTFLGALADLEDACFGFLHEFLDVLCLIKSFLFYLCRHGDEVTSGRFLRDDLRMIA